MYEFEIISDARQFENLKSEWDALWRSSAEARVAQSFDYCWSVWQTVTASERRKMFCVLGRSGGRLALAWPLLSYSKYFRTFLRPFGATGAEYTDILVDSSEDKNAWLENAWRFVQSNSRADFIVLPFVRLESQLQSTLAASNGNAKVESDVAFVTQTSGEASWDSYYDSLSKSHRRKHGNLKRRLDEQGVVAFEIIEAGDSRCAGLVRWMLEQKRVWAERTGKRGEWLYSAGYQDLLTRLLANGGDGPKLMIMALTLNDVPIAVKSWLSRTVFWNCWSQVLTPNLTSSLQVCGWTSIG